MKERKNYVQVERVTVWCGEKMDERRVRTNNVKEENDNVLHGMGVRGVGRRKECNYVKGSRLDALHWNQEA